MSINVFSVLGALCSREISSVPIRCFFFRRVWVLKTVVGEVAGSDLRDCGIQMGYSISFFFDLGVMQSRREKGNAGTKNKK